MRHAIAGNRLNRSGSLRKATLRDLAKATLMEERICTTKAKAKEARKLVDRLITLGKNGTLVDRRRAFSILCDHGLVSQLFKETSSRFKKRMGGYTRIVSLGARRGDNAQLVLLELTEKKEVIISHPKSEAAEKKETLKALPSQEKVGHK
ncbi:MAG: 50S ribosomal protein L17, partial [Candidatus Omnitrophica bacterium]|nr:50S ribosomal protein L17 [Candidatus Omnitrophota bacterium]